MSKRLAQFKALTWLLFAVGTIAASPDLVVGAETNGDKTTFIQPAKKTLPELFMSIDTCNSYVLRVGDAALLINLGDGGVLKRLPNLGVKRIEWILFTDHHRENCQGIASVDRSVTKVAVSETERELFEKPTQFRKWYPKLGDKYSVYGASYVRPPSAPIPVDRSLSDGEKFVWRGFTIECLSTPGTSPGGMSFLISRDGETFAFTGGVMHNDAKMTNWFDSEWDYGFGKGVDVLMASVERLIAAKITTAFPSQGTVIASADDQFEAYLKKLKMFRASYIRGYPVFDKDVKKRDPISKPTPVDHINRVTPHLYKLSHKTQGKNFAIIVSDSGRGLVLDCGLFPTEMLEEIVVGMREHLGLKSIDAFWISHMHGDHFLLGPTMKAKYGAAAWTLDRIVDRCEHPRRYDYAALVSAYGDGFDGMKIDKKFRDGETVKWEGYTIHVDWMPGQTEFGCCLWLDIDGKRIAFTGDNLFGSPADETQTGHEAVVCRNSAILEEGYVLGSKYLLDLKPDIVMGSHSYVMPEPMPFLQRYHDWSKRMVALYEGLLPDRNYEYLFDPYWVSAYPYRVDFIERDSRKVTVTVRNFRNQPQKHRVRLKLPDGVTAEPSVLEGVVAANNRAEFQVKLTIDRTKTAAGVQIIPFDITLDGKHYGELFDFLIRTDVGGNH